MSTISPSEKRNDLHLTTTGIGYAYKPSVPFPSNEFKTQHSKPLPSKLCTPCGISIDDMYVTTTGSMHDYKPKIYDYPLYKKAPSSLKVNHTLDTVMNLEMKPWRRALTMGNQSSETHDRYKGKSDNIEALLSHPESLVHGSLTDHFKEGPTKELKPTTTISKLQGKNFKPEDQAILHRNEPYMTTNNWFHRTFTRKELNKYPKKDIVTYWQCEDYPKAWGFGMKENPLPRRLNKTDPGPLRDRMIFRTSTTVPYVSTSLQPISHGLKSVYSSTYVTPPEEKRQCLFSCPVQPAFKTVKDTSLLETVPKMYESVNRCYGTTKVS